MNAFNKMLCDINKLILLFKNKYIYFYELPSGYNNHMWKLKYDFLNKFNFVFCQIGQFIDNKKYFWIPCRSYFLDINKYKIDFKNKKLLANCPISSGYNIKRVNLIKNIAYKYNIDIYGRIFNNINDKYIKNKIQHIEPRNSSNYDIGFNKLNVLNKYKFIIVSENCNTYGYISERIIDILLIGCIPIYYGENTEFLFSNNINIIDGNSFKNIDEMYNYISSIDEISYNKMIETNNKYIINNIKYFIWSGIWEFIIKKILNEEIESDNLINNANIFLGKKYIDSKKKIISDNTGKNFEYILY